MNISNKTYTITEFNSFSRDNDLPNYQSLPKTTFDALENFLLSQDVEAETNINEFLSLSYHKRIGKIITAKNYVGILTITDGTVIEILPKIAGKGVTHSEARKILLEMLQTVDDVKFKASKVSNVDTAELNLYEIFIQMFLEEIVQLTRVGMKSAYSVVEENERFYKGKLNVSENIKYNLAHKERFYVQYDEFNMNRPENRLIKSTLQLLSKVTRNAKNIQLIMQLLSNFEQVDFSINYNADFSSSILNRSMKHYEKALTWCRIFLKQLSFTVNKGAEVSIALLFPMERLFESYISFMLRKNIRNTQFKLHTQDNSHSLFSYPKKSFSLRPDIVLESDKNSIVMDTKWKVLSENKGNKGITQTDMYQMYAYGKKYNASKVLLLYPLSEMIDDTDLYFLSDDGVYVEIHFIDLREAFLNVRTLLETLTI